MRMEVPNRCTFVDHEWQDSRPRYLDHTVNPRSAAALRPALTL